MLSIVLGIMAIFVLPVVLGLSYGLVYKAGYDPLNLIGEVNE